MPQDVWYKPKLIEVALPLEEINRESAREKSIRHGHPSTLHLWWAPRPLAACRAVLFAQLVDDKSAHQDKFPTEEDQAVERKRLHDIISRLVEWENIHDERPLREAREEIQRSTGSNPPPILDPFADGGSIPLGAQRLSLEAHASDVNPVAVLINKVRLLSPQDLPVSNDPATDDRTSEWETCLHLARRLSANGVETAAPLMAQARNVDSIDLDDVRELAYLLYSIEKQKGWTDFALLFNGLGTSRTDIDDASTNAGVVAGMTTTAPGDGLGGPGKLPLTFASDDAGSDDGDE